MIYYIADPHFGHTGIIDRCERPFTDVVDMNDHMIAFWNHRVTKNDTVYIIGDMFHHCEPAAVKSILKHLNGHKHMIIGNHDLPWLSKINSDKYFESVSNLLEVKDEKRVCVLCHYPILTWRREDKAYMIYGHIHDNTSADFWPLLSRQVRMLNAGVEVNHYAPATLDELIANNESFKAVHSVKTLMEYRGFTGSIEVSLAERRLTGKVLKIDDLVGYDAETVNDIEREFCHAVDVYLDCLADEAVWEDAEIEARESAVAAAEAENEAEREAIIEEVEKKERDYFKEAMDEYDAEHEDE